MGYRSNVRCLIYGTEEKLEAFLTYKLLITGTSVFRDMGDSLTRYSITHSDYQGDTKTIHVLDLYLDRCKWYEDYEDVKAWHTFMDQAEEADLDYEFIRIGEDSGDIERSETENSLNLIYTSNPTIHEEFDRKKEIPLLFK